MTTCPSGVHYMHLVDHARKHIARTFRRPFGERWLRKLLAVVLPRPALFRGALRLAGFGRPIARILPGRLGAMTKLAPAKLPEASPVDRPQVFKAEGVRLKRAALLSGCVQTVLRPGINEATIRLLTRHGVEVVVAAGAGCCGALTHHLGEESPALNSARRNIAAWWRVIEGQGLDAIVVNASGCGTMVKDYGFLLREDREWAEKAAKVAALTRDITEILDEIGLRPVRQEGPRRVAYHSACSMQHGQGLDALPRRLIASAGFELCEIPDGHLCCGSAGSYSILQPGFAGQLKTRKLANIARAKAEVLVAGNIGCLEHLAGGLDLPMIHTAELLDWATGGPKPAGLNTAAG